MGLFYRGTIRSIEPDDYCKYLCSVTAFETSKVKVCDNWTNKDIIIEIMMVPLTQDMDLVLFIINIYYKYNILKDYVM